MRASSCLGEGVRRRRVGGWGLGGWGRRPQKYTATTPRGSTAEAATFHRRTETRPRELNTLPRCSFPPGDPQKNYSWHFLLFRGTSPIPKTLTRIENILFEFKSGEPENGSHPTGKRLICFLVALENPQISSELSEFICLNVSFVIRNW